jgi:hypothetical protein
MRTHDRTEDAAEDSLKTGNDAGSSGRFGGARDTRSGRVGADLGDVLESINHSANEVGGRLSGKDRLKNLVETGAHSVEGLSREELGKDTGDRVKVHAEREDAVVGNEAVDQVDNRLDGLVGCA